ncbi:MAG: radical SAM family heme chaperone HemW [Termitinemataceae bacterium]|nr:MAG: radical SAM family heme chaperone HemW [Termitinemataceae bacterium]
MKASLYIHIPFCFVKCDYCNFYSVPLSKFDPKIIGPFLLHLFDDIQIQINKFNVTEIITIYIGGGSPSILGIEYFEKLLNFLKSIIPNNPQEFTVELNPEFTSVEFLLLCKQFNVNRMSIGVQSFNSKSRQAIGRICSSDKIDASLKLLSNLYCDSYSADLISGLPHQDLLSDIKILTQYKPAHISLYDLTVEENTPLYKKINLNKINLPTPEFAEEAWIQGRDLLENLEFKQYEVSNFCKPNGQSVHNIRYWRMENWIAAGPSSSATIIDDQNAIGKRYTTQSDIQNYLQNRKTNYIIEELTKETLIKESLLMGFRYIKGPCKKLFFKRFGINITDLIPKTIKSWKDNELMQEKELALTKDGLLLLNSFLADCFLEIESK